MRRLLTMLLVFGAGAAGAQENAVTIDPGMTRAEVVERLGAPATVSTRGSYVYLFFRNGCEDTCGMSDLVMLDNDAVVDAIFRAPGRRFSGASTSPTGIAPERTITGAPRAIGATGPTAGDRPGALIIAEPSPAPANADSAAPASAEAAPSGPVAPARLPGQVGGVRIETALPSPAIPDVVVGDTAVPSGDSASVVMDSTALPVAAPPVPFQGSQRMSADSIRAAQERARADTARKPFEE